MRLHAVLWCHLFIVSVVIVSFSGLLFEKTCSYCWWGRTDVWSGQVWSGHDGIICVAQFSEIAWTVIFSQGFQSNYISQFDCVTM